MKKTALAFIIAAVSMMILVSISASIKTAEANGENYSIQQINHTIQVMYNGYIFINDTIQIVGNASDGTALPSFVLGFPYKYGSNVLRCLAYDSSGFLKVTPSVPLENRIGFYAVEVSFAQPLNISSGAAHNFTVGFVLSNNLLNASATNSYILDVPAYPSLTKTATNCSVAIILPEGAENVTVAKEDGVVNASAYNEENLPAFTYSPANVTFSLTGNKMQLFDITKLEREVTIDGIGEIEGSDSYYLTSKSPTNIASIEVILPSNASDVTAYDQFGRSMSGAGWSNETTNLYRVNFSLPMESYKSTRFVMSYHLQSQVYINAQEGTSNFNVTFPLFQHVNYYAEQASVAFLLPEGARIVNYTLIGNAYSVTTNVFQETVTVNRQGISLLEDVFPSENILQIVYAYDPLWLSFRPTLWVWAVATVGCAVVAIWKRPKAPVPVAVPAVVVRVRPEQARSFVNLYEEKRKIVSELESLEAMVRKGRVPRRRYKVLRKTLETRLNTLTRSLAESKEKMRVAGGKYADLMRQLEIAETEINEGEANIRSIEGRHSRGEISLETYRKLLSDYQRRKENAETAISGILLRLREEIR